MNLTILPTLAEDLEFLLQLQKDCYLSEAELYDDYHIPPLLQTIESIETEFENLVFLKAVSNGEIVGSVRAFSDSETCYIGKLIVSNQHQNKGIGQQLLVAIEAQFTECNRFELFTGHKSQKNLYLYGKMGYTEVSQQPVTDNLTLVYLEKRK